MLELALAGLVALGGLGSPGAPSTHKDTTNRPRTDLPVHSEEIFVVGDAPLVEKVRPGQPVHVIFSVGELGIEATDTDEVRAEIVADCRKLTAKKCERLRERLSIEPRQTEQGLEVRMTGMARRGLRKIAIKGRVTVPRDSRLTATLGIGDVEIHAGDEDLSVLMRIGDLTIRAPAAAVGSATVRTRIGDASVHLPRGGVEGKRRKLIGARASWSEGEGDARIDVGLKIGDATVILESSSRD